MPKIVDHEERRRLIARAACQVARRDGVGAVTVRSVAGAAGLSPGALRHYFSRQDDLVRAAMEQVVEQIRERIAGLDLPTDPLAAVLLLIEQVLPLDDVRREEMEIWLAFSAKAPYDPSLAAVSRSSHDGLRELATSAVAELDQAGLLAPGVDAGLEATRLHALIDGLATHAYLHPDRVPAETLRATARYHLESLLAAPSGR